MYLIPNLMIIICRSLVGVASSHVLTGQVVAHSLIPESTEDLG